MKRRILRSILRILIGTVVALVGILFAVWLYVAQPSFRSNAPTEVTVDPARLKRHVTVLSRDLHPRSYLSFAKLEATAKYIEGHFRKAGAEVSSQDCSFGTRSYRNVIGTFGTGAGNKVVIGAHYDSCWETPGADDNASGVAGLIELAYHTAEDTADRLDYEAMARVTAAVYEAARTIGRKGGGKVD